jgi:pseudouridine synthase
MIKDGRVRLNGRVVTELGTKADPRSDRIDVDGKRMIRPKTWTYIVMNKPTGTVTTAKDEFDRKTVLEVVKGVEARIYPVGRLDLDAEGVLILTNDGDLAAALTHPSGRIEKVYRCKVRGEVGDEAIERLGRGVVLEDGFAQATGVRRMPSRVQMERNAWIELTVTEGRNHLIKRMCDSVGHPVVRLQRRTFAGLSCPDLKPGQWRHLRKEELKKLKAQARAAKRRREQHRTGSQE